jgi:guanosine-3',5'-bis(diphosphate) 3'-pyrophosphohydrolase
VTGTLPSLAPDLGAVLERHADRLDLDMVERALRFSASAHRGQKRMSGEDFVSHTIAVALILAEQLLDSTTIVAALLHDVVEDSDVRMEDIAREFGPEVAGIVDGLTKISSLTFHSSAEEQVENYRKLLLSIAKDARVIIIKLGDRLHNMRTLEHLPPERRTRIALETREIYAPLAHRFGMAGIKAELEDLAFKFLEPEDYRELAQQVAAKRAAREQTILKLKTPLDFELQEAGIDWFEVTGRPKHLWSIFQKMKKRGKAFDEIYDLMAVRVIVRTVPDCYHVLGIIHHKWTPIQELIKDYIASPKSNAYQSLHTTVFGPGGQLFEVQIRTQDMHRTAEFGIAAHWRYKETKGKHGSDTAEVDDMAWMRQLLDWQREAADPGEFLESLRYDLAVKEIFVFTPKGDVITLPAGSTPVDFAYAVHTEVGHRCIGARVNGRLVALERKLENGEVVEVFTSKAVNAGPSRDWQTFVVSPRAKAKIRQWFAKERREEALEAGKEAIAKEVRRGGLPLQRLLNAESMSAIAHELHYADVSALYTAVGEHNVSAQHVVQRLVAQLGGVGAVEEELAERSTPSTMPMRPRRGTDAGVLVPGAEGTVAKLAKCCTPVPGDEIMGFVTRGGAVSVHRTDCTNAKSLREQEERIIEVQWAPSASSVFLVAIQIEALDRHRLLSDVTKALADEKVNILSASVTTSGDRVAISRFTFEMGDPKHLGHVLNVVRNVEGVYDVYRTTSAA